MQLLIVAPAHRPGLRKLGAERTGDDRIDKIQMSRKPSLDVGDLVPREQQDRPIGESAPNGKYRGQCVVLIERLTAGHGEDVGLACQPRDPPGPLGPWTMPC